MRPRFLKAYGPHRLADYSSGAGELSTLGPGERVGGRATGMGSTGFLAKRAARPAQSWKFRPARLAAGGAIASTQVIYFTFPKLSR
ncbi:MAG: hypothetical protein QM757_33715 [Paludibaculum sp.]